MRSVFRSKFKVTQGFGVNSDYYKKFGLKAHEGIDLIPTGSVWEILCPENGVVVRDVDDATLGKNYGKNVTVWHPTIRKATQYCHLNSNNVKMGDRLKRGDILGVMGNTGNTSGAHLHLNLFNVDDNGVRLNRDNGYFGGIDPLPFLEEDTPQPTSCEEELKQARSDRDKNHNDRYALFQELGGEGDYSHTWAVTEIRQLRSIAAEQPTKDELIRTLRAELATAKQKLETAQMELISIKGTADAAHQTAETVSGEVREAIDKVDEIEKKTDEASRDSRSFLDFILEWLVRWKIRR